MSYEQPPQPPNEPSYQFPPTQPPYPPSPPVPAPRPPRRSHIGWIILGVFFVCTVLCCSFGALVATGALNRGGGACSQPAGSTPTPAGLQPISAPVLGATEHDFCLRYGSPSDAFDPFNSGPPSQSWQVSTIAGYQVDMLATDNDNARDSRDGRLRIADIEVSTLGGVP